MFPVGDFLRRRTTPYVNWTLIAINFAVFFYSLNAQPEIFLHDWGFKSACIARDLGLGTSASARDLNLVCNGSSRDLLQVFTSMFVHASWLHILSNMLFLWIFGDNVEDRVGHGRYLVFYLVCGIIASATQIVMTTSSLVITVGASGAIAGVLAAYLVLYPTAMVSVIILPLFFIPFVLPAVVLIGIWFVTQLFSGLSEIGQTTAGTGVAWWAHIGGFIAGAVLVLLFRQAEPRRARIPDI